MYLYLSLSLNTPSDHPTLVTLKSKLRTRVQIGFFFLTEKKNYIIEDISGLREPILDSNSAKEREKYVLSRGGVFVVFSTSAFWAILKKPVFFSDILIKYH